MKRIRVLMSIMLTAFGVAIAISWAFWGNITQAVAQSRVSEDGKYQLSADGKKLEIFLGEKEVSFAVPDGVETIGYSAFGPAFKLRSLVIPASVGVIEENAFPNCSELTSFEVAENNRAFRSIEGVLFSKDGKTLVRYPQGKKSDVYYVPRGVETIEPGAFEDCRSLKAVVFPNGVKTIGARAFYGCVPLRSLAFPASLESVGESAFDYCLLLSSVLVAEDNPNYRSIDGVLFSKDGKTALYYPQGKEQVKYAISKDVENVAKDAFKLASKLEAFEVDRDSDNFRLIDGVLFSKDGTVLVRYPGGKKLEKYVVPDGVKTIAAGAFFRSGATLSDGALKTVEIPEGVETIGDDAFCQCYALRSVVLPKSVKSIGDRAFDECSQSLTIKGSNDSYARFYANSPQLKFEPIDPDEPIGSVAQYIPDDPNPQYKLSPDGKTLYGYVENGQKLVVPDGVEIIEFNSLELINAAKIVDFNGVRPPAYTLKTIVIPESVKEIRDMIGSFNALTSIEVAEDNPCFCSIGGVLYSKDKKTLIRVPPKTNTTPFVVPDGVEKIASSAFYNCGFLVSIVLPKSLKSIGDTAFANCSAQRLAIPESVETIGRNAFLSYSLKSIDVMGNNPNYRSDGGVLYSKDGKVLVSVPAVVGGDSYSVSDDVVRIGEGAFSSCHWLKEVVVPDGVQEIGDGAFVNCSQLKTIDLPGSVEKIGYNAIPSREATIRAPKGSFAEQYAKREKKNFAPLD